MYVCTISNISQILLYFIFCVGKKGIEHSMWYVWHWREVFKMPKEKFYFPLVIKSLTLFACVCVYVKNMLHDVKDEMVIKIVVSRNFFVCDTICFL